MTALNEEQITVFLGKLTGWRHNDGALRKVYPCSSFRQAAEFAVGLADICEQEGHYPELALTEKKISVKLSTSTAGGITGKDFLLAERFDKLLAK